jgi:uncharacterized protein YgbK (DUF1537 family)
MSAPALAYYSDDFTGATDSLEVLAEAGLPTRLFLDPPDPADLAGANPPLVAIGVAGNARTLTRHELDRVVPDVFERLKRLGASMIHYKVCSTFDSAPDRGSIGRAIEHGVRAFSPPVVPLIVGAPRLGRYTVFGNLFAQAGLDSPVFRLDRHPGMVNHPSTPMHEADILRHLAEQTDLPAQLVDVTRVERDPACVRAALGTSEIAIVLIDVLSIDHLRVIGEAIYEAGATFVVGSSSVEDALVAEWRRRGLVSVAQELRPLSAASPILVVSGSASPVTDAQLGAAIDDGFVDVPADTRRLVSATTADAERRRLVRAATDSLRLGKSVVVHTARGVSDERIRGARASVGLDTPVLASLSQQLALLIEEVVATVDVARTVVVGGDTSSQVARSLGIVALDAVARTAPGAPLCRVQARGSALDGAELIFKGGQNGGREYFRFARDGIDSARSNMNGVT